MVARRISSRSVKTHILAFPLWASLYMYYAENGTQTFYASAALPYMEIKSCIRSLTRASFNSHACHLAEMQSGTVRLKGALCFCVQCFSKSWHNPYKSRKKSARNLQIPPFRLQGQAKYSMGWTLEDNIISYQVSYKKFPVIWQIRVYCSRPWEHGKESREKAAEKMHDCGARKIDDLNNILGR